MFQMLFSRYRNILILTGIFFIICGLYTELVYRPMSNHGIIILSVTGLIQLIIEKQSVSKLFRSPLFSPFIIIFLFLILTLSYTDQENMGQAFHYFEKRLIFFALPLAFIALPIFDKKYYDYTFYLFFILTLSVSIWTFFYFLTDKEKIINDYTSSGIMPTFVNHVRFSLMICYAIVIGFSYMKFDKANLRNRKMIALLLSICFLILFLHILAVRSGLVAFYTIVAIGIIYQLFKKNYVKSFSLLSIMAILLFIAFSYIATFKARWGYTMYDLQQSSIEESANYYSLTKRLVSNQVGYKVFKSSPIFGTGEANLQSEIHKVYKKDFPYIKTENYLDPHNQYLTILAGTGIIGFLLFWSCFYYPLFKNRNYRRFTLWSIYLILTISFFAEDTLQTQLGFVFGLFFIMINLHQLKEVNSSNN